MAVFDFTTRGIRPLDLQFATPSGWLVKLVADCNWAIPLDHGWQR